MFEKKRYVLFVGKRFIEPGMVTLGKTASFEGGEALSYTSETLADALRNIRERTTGKVRVVLSEELVYVTEISFPASTSVTRESIREKAEEFIPDDLHDSQWDFETLHYTEKRKESETLVQVAMIERSFAEALKAALAIVSLPLESVVPESYALASFVADREGVSVIVERDRESTTLIATEQGSVISTYVQDSVTTDDLSLFLGFVKGKGKEVKRIVFSHFAEEEVAPFRIFEEQGYEVLAENYNPLIGAAAQDISGRDEAVLNIDMFRTNKKPWWRFRS